MSSSTLQPTGEWAGTAFAHEAFIYSRDEEALARVLPFVEEGLARGESVIVVASEMVRGALAARLGADVARLAVLVPSEEWWTSGFATLQAHDQDLQQLKALGRPWRLVCEPTWLALPDGRVWSRFEAVANDAHAALPYYSLCLHDTRRLVPDVIDAVLRTHPLTWSGTGPVPSPGYEATADYLRAVEPAWTLRPEGAQTRTLADSRDARAMVRDLLGESAAADDRGQDVALAVNELVSNAVRAAGEAQVSSWRDDGRVVWEVADDGVGMHDATAGYVPPGLELDSGRGLWLARSLASDATVRPYGPGTAIRLYFDLAPGA